MSKIELRKGGIHFVGLVLFLHLTAVGLSAIITSCLDFGSSAWIFLGEITLGISSLPPAGRKGLSLKEGKFHPLIPIQTEAPPAAEAPSPFSSFSFPSFLPSSLLPNLIPSSRFPDSSCDAGIKEQRLNRLLGKEL